jgi:hypothetical protein
MNGSEDLRSRILFDGKAMQTLNQITTWKHIKLIYMKFPDLFRMSASTQTIFVCLPGAQMPDFTG